MKKFYFVLINIFVIALLLIIADYSFFAVEKAKYLRECETSAGFFKKNQIVHYAEEIKHSFITTGEEDRTFDKKSDKAIMLLGCSYTFGAELEPNQTFSYYLSEQTNRTVYNLGVNGGGIQQALYLTTQPDFVQNHPNVDLIIYTFIEDHLNRNNEFLKCSIFSPYCNFRLVKKGDKYVTPNEWYANPSKIYLFRFLLDGITAVKNSKFFYKKNCETFVDMVNKTEQNLKKMYPDAKFVFLFYHCKKPQILTDNFDKDICILSTIDDLNLNLDNVKYRHGDDWHPSELAWQTIVPRLVEKLHKINYL